MGNPLSTAASRVTHLAFQRTYKSDNDTLHSVSFWIRGSERGVKYTEESKGKEGREVSYFDISEVDSQRFWNCLDKSCLKLITDLAEARHTHTAAACTTIE
jgi:hypothetical protein